ncbi:lytic transglycosylase domain-containing protein [Candidatus Puniceispirillum marinum]|nr:lytic transglycosylase domain-containing protein [Candidatus Puniceispirillum marinum]
MSSHVWARDVDCEALAAQAEIDYAIPSGIMQGIARVESGRIGLDGKRRSWPWTVNDGVEGLFFEDQASALEFVEVSYANGENSVDVGCMQINTKWHKDNFRDFAEMFDPNVNMDYAASFLIILRNRHGSWDQAIRHYHSNDPSKNERYVRKVHAVMAVEGHELPSSPQLMKAVLTVPSTLPKTKPKPRPKVNVAMSIPAQPKALPQTKPKIKIGLKTLAASKIPEPISGPASVTKDSVSPSVALAKPNNNIIKAKHNLPKNLSKPVAVSTLPVPVAAPSGDDLIKQRQPHIAKNWRKVLEFRAGFAKQG